MAESDRSDDGEPVSDTLFSIASRWHARMRQPEVGDRARRDFARWLARDPRHEQAYAQAERLWQNLAAPAKAVAPDDQERIAELIRSVRGRSRQRRGTVLALAGLMLLAGAGEWWRRGGLDDLRADLVTVPGASEHRVLADGSEIWLNTDTAVATDFTPGERRLRLFRGEAFLKVKPDRQRPFVVATDDGLTRVTGTQFNLRKRESDTLVSLVEGAVEVRAEDNASASARLRPGQEVTVGRVRLGAVHDFDANTVTAWRRGQIVFFQTPLGQVVEELNRYRRGRIVVLSPRLSALPVTGVFDTAAPADAIGVIEATLGIKAIRLTDALVLLY